MISNKNIFNIIAITFLAVALPICGSEIRTIKFKDSSTTIAENKHQNKIVDFEKPENQPRSIKIFEITSDTSYEDTSITEQLLAEKLKLNESKVFKHLGDYRDPVFYLDTNVVLGYEKNIDLPKINLIEYQRYFLLIKKLFDSKLYEQILTEISAIKKKRLFIDERIKLDFISAECLLQLGRYDDMLPVLKSIGIVDTSKRFENSMFYYFGKQNEKTQKHFQKTTFS